MTDLLKFWIDEATTLDGLDLPRPRRSMQPNITFRTPPELGPFWRARPMNGVRFKTIAANMRRKK